MLRRTNGAVNLNSDLVVFRSTNHQIIDVLGKGSFSNVYLDQFVYDEKGAQVTKLFAVKVIDTSLVSKVYSQKFLPREFKVLSLIKHPYIIYTYRILENDLKYYMFMQYAEKGHVLDYVTLNGEQKEDVARVWMHQLSHAIHYLHLQGIVHRDIKCENVLLTESLTTKLTDFGFSRPCHDLQQGLSSTFCGTLAYSAPEVVQGEPYNPKLSDVWSLGVVLFYMLNKQFPFEFLTKRMLYQNAMKRRWKYNAKVELRLSAECKQLLTSMLNPKPTKGERYTMEQVVDCEWLKMDPRLATERAELKKINVVKVTNNNTEAFQNTLEKAVAKKLKKLNGDELNKILSSVK